MYGDLDIQRNLKSRDISHHYSYGSQKIFSPVVSRPSNQLNQSHNFLRGVENLCNSGATTPYANYEYGNSLQSRPFGNIESSNYSHGLNFDEPVPSLNYVSERLPSTRGQLVPLLSFNPQIQQRYSEDSNGRKSSIHQKRRLPTIVPRHQMSSAKVDEVGFLDNVDICHPKLGLVRRKDYIDCSHQSHQLSKPLRKRVRSENSTESCDSYSYKFAKTSERYQGSKRAKGRARQAMNCSSPESRSKRNRFRKASSPKNLNKRESYNMKRLDLGPSIGSVREQQELKSRLKAMVFIENTPKEDFSIVVPSLPITLTPSTEIPKYIDE